MLFCLFLSAKRGRLTRRLTAQIELKSLIKFNVRHGTAFRRRFTLWGWNEEIKNYFSLLLRFKTHWVGSRAKGDMKGQKKAHRQTINEKLFVFNSPGENSKEEKNGEEKGEARGKGKITMMEMEVKRYSVGDKRKLFAVLKGKGKKRKLLMFHLPMLTFKQSSIIVDFFLYFLFLFSSVLRHSITTSVCCSTPLFTAF